MPSVPMICTFSFKAAFLNAKSPVKRIILRFLAMARAILSCIDNFGYIFPHMSASKNSSIVISTFLSPKLSKSFRKFKGDINSTIY